MAVLVLFGAALVVKVAGPVVAAAAELLHVLLIVAVVLLSLGAVGLVGLPVYRVQRTLADAARVAPPS
jgi:hypothetical protein